MVQYLQNIHADIHGKAAALLFWLLSRSYLHRTITIRNVTNLCQN